MLRPLDLMPLMDPATEAPMLLTIEDAAKRLTTSERHVRELIYRRRLPFVKVGRLVRFDRGDLEAWIADRKVAAEVDPEGVLEPAERARRAEHARKSAQSRRRAK